MSGQRHERHHEPPSEDERARLRAEKEAAKREEMFAKLREQTEGLLDAIEAPSLIVVDDKASPIETYLMAFSADHDGLEDLGQEEGEIDADSEPELWEGKVRAVWDALSPDERRDQIRRSRAVLVRTTPGRTLGHLEALEGIFPSGRVSIIEPQEWDEQSEALASGATPPLVLFDQELGSFRVTGLDLLQEYRNRPRALGALDPPAGILSNQVNSDGELTTMDASDKSKVPAGSLMIVSKAFLSTARYPEAVALLRLTANLPHLTKMRDHVLEGLRSDIADAIATVEHLRPRVLEDLVYRSSEVEGAWEGETMARIAGLYVLRATRDREARDTELAAVIAKARKLSRWVQDNDAGSTHAGLQLHRLENFSDGLWVNRLQLPLANGDIFQVRRQRSGETVIGFMVMVGQPCDLVVRSDGAREAQEVAVLELNAKSSRPKAMMLEEPLPDAPPDPLPQYAGVNLKKEFTISLDVLDLCWMNTDGVATITDVTEESSDLMLTEGLTIRRDQIRERARRVLDHLEGLEQQPELRDLLVEQQTSGKAALVYDPEVPKTWSYDIQRVARLAPRQADALLVRYSAAQARAAFDHELTRFSH